MLNDTLQEIYTAIVTKNNAYASELIGGLNKAGMDNATIKILINELLKDNVIK